MPACARAIQMSLLSAMLYAAPSLAQTMPPSGRQVEAPAERVITLFQSSDRVLVMMRIDGGELLPMVFDTGTDGNSIDRRIVRRDRLKKVGESTEVDGTTGKQRILPQVRMNNVSLGGVTVPTADAVALDFDPDDAMGIISPDVFADSLVFLELGRSRARLVAGRPDSIPHGPPTPYWGNLPSTMVQLPDGSNVQASFDTGYNGAISLPLAMMGKVELMEPVKVVGRFQSINTEGEVYGGQVKGSVRIGSVVLENPPVVFLGEKVNIGLPVIRQLTLVLDPARRQSWVLPATE